MNIVVLIGSPRKNGNTELLANAFAHGAAQQHHVEILSVRDFHVHPCLGCNHCFKTPTHTCCQRDDMGLIYEKLHQADMCVIASPVYFYGLSAQIKTVIDRLHNPVRDHLHIRKMALLLVGAASLPQLFDAILMEYRLCLDFFKLEDVGRVLAKGINEPGAIIGHPALKQAYELGQSL